MRGISKDDAGCSTVTQRVRMTYRLWFLLRPDAVLMLVVPVVTLTMTHPFPWTAHSKPEPNPNVTDRCHASHRCSNIIVLPLHCPARAISKYGLFEVFLL